MLSVSQHPMLAAVGCSTLSYISRTEGYLDFTRLVTDMSIGMLDLLQRIKDSNVTLKVRFCGSRCPLSLMSSRTSLTTLCLSSCGDTDLALICRVNSSSLMNGSTSPMVITPRMLKVRAAYLRYQIQSLSMASLRALGQMLGVYLRSGLALSYGLATSIFYLQVLVQIK